MAVYRKKPVLIRAFKWTGCPDQDEDPVWIIEAIKDGAAHIKTAPLRMLIDTLEGLHTAMPGDYIVQGIKGELYPCKADIFEETNEFVEAE